MTCRWVFSLLLAGALTIGLPNTSIAESDGGDIYDPIESVNRGIFWFNDQVDTYFLEPVARGYRWITPSFFRTGVSNFFRNLDSAQYFVSDIVQLKFEQALVHSGRFLVNTTLGVGGVFDAADSFFDLEHHQEDFGTALGYHGVGPGPYIVLPLLGPSNLRDAVGRGVDTFLSPFYWISEINHIRWETELMITGGAAALDAINTRESLLDAVESAKQTSLDYYLFTRKAYYQNREGLIHDGAVSEAGEWDFGEDEQN